MTYRRVLDLTRASLDRAHHDFAGVDTDAALNRHTTLGQYFGRIPLELFLHAQCCIERALRMVLMGDRCTE
jgi:hypothetical protein